MPEQPEQSFPPNYWVPTLEGFVVQGWEFSGYRNKVVAVGDFNRDGYTDFVLGVEASTTAPSVLTYLRSDGLGGHVIDTMTFASVPMETAIAEVADFNGDGILDIALFDLGEYQSGMGMFQGGAPRLMLGDGHGGFIVSNALEQAIINAPLGTYLGDYSGGALHVKDVTSGDIDNDGDIDFWIESTGGNNIRNHFMINNGDGTFTVDPGRIERETLSGEPAYTPTGPFWRYGQGELIDVDGDGWLDLVLGQNRDDHFTHETQHSFVVYNDGTGHFPLANRVALPHPDFYNGYTATQGIAAADINGDGMLDLVLLSTRKNAVAGAPVDLGYQGRFIQVLIANGDGTFRDETSARMGDQSAWASPSDGNAYNNAENIRFEDIDGDGDLDMLIGQGQGPIRASGPNVFVNNGSGQFSPIDPRWFTADSDWWGEDGWSGDFNSDGILDHLHLDQLPGPNGNYDGGAYPNDDTVMIVLQYGRYLMGPARAVGDTRADGTSGADSLSGGGGRDSIWGLAGNDVIQGLADDDSLMGDAGDDVLFGGDGQDVLNGGVGNDILIGGSGSDTLIGGDGYDIAVYSGARGGYATATYSGVVGGVEGGTDNISGVEALAFVDGQLTFHRDGIAAQVMRLYDSAFNRIPDAGGFEAQLDAMEGGMSLNTLAQLFVESVEFQNIYGALSDQQFVEQLYRNVLDREGDEGGIQNALNAIAGGQSRGQIMLAFSESVEHISLTRSLWIGGVSLYGAAAAPVEAKGTDEPLTLPGADEFVLLPDKSDDGALVLPGVDDGLVWAKEADQALVLPGLDDGSTFITPNFAQPIDILPDDGFHGLRNEGWMH